MFNVIESIQRDSLEVGCKLVSECISKTAEVDKIAVLKELNTKGTEFIKMNIRGKDKYLYKNKMVNKFKR